MILSDVAIHEAIDEGRLVITPEPLPRLASLAEPSRPYDRSAVDLHLSDTLLVPKEHLSIQIDFQSGNVPNTISAISDAHPIPVTGYPLAPGKFVLGNTREWVKLPLPSEFPDDETIRAKPCLAARVEGKSSRARFGLLIHFTAPTVHAGFEGNITLEMMNLGPTTIMLTPGLAICQLVIEEVRGAPAAAQS